MVEESMDAEILRLEFWGPEEVSSDVPETQKYLIQNVITKINVY